MYSAVALNGSFTYSSFTCEARSPTYSAVSRIAPTTRVSPMYSAVALNGSLTYSSLT